MLLHEIVNEDPNINELVAAVTDWSLHSSKITNQMIGIIAKNLDQFKYTGPMVRRLVIADGNTKETRLQPHNIKQRIIQDERASRVSSWSKTKKGMLYWWSMSGNEDDLEFDEDEKRLYVVDCAQSGVGFDIPLFVQWMNQQKLPLGGNLEDAAEAQEVIATITPAAKITMVDIKELDTPHDAEMYQDYISMIPKRVAAWNKKIVQ